MERAVRGELRVHHVARQAEHHRPARRRVDDQEHDRVGAHAVSRDRPVATEQQDAHPLATAPRVLVGDPSRGGGGAVLGEEGLDQVRLRGGDAHRVRDGQRSRDAGQRHQDGARRGAQPACPQRTGTQVGREHADRPDAYARTEHPRHRAKPRRVRGQLDERAEVPQRAEEVDRTADGREQEDVTDQAAGPEETGARQDGSEQGHPERAPHGAGAPEAEPGGPRGPVASRMTVHESRMPRRRLVWPGHETRVGQEFTAGWVDARPRQRATGPRRWSLDGAGGAGRRPRRVAVDGSAAGRRTRADRRSPPRLLRGRGAGGDHG